MTTLINDYLIYRHEMGPRPQITLQASCHNGVVGGKTNPSPNKSDQYYLSSSKTTKPSMPSPKIIINLLNLAILQS